MIDFKKYVLGDYAVLDFETKGIEARPAYPPEPCGVALKTPWHPKTRYFGHGHPIENNCTAEETEHEVRRVWDSDLPIVMHNAKFDVDVACEAYGLPMLPPERIHCTQILSFLHDPEARAHHLKTRSDELLGLPPEEQDAVREWLKENHPKVTKVTKGWGAFICDAPGALVGRYAIGDVDRTDGLFKLFMDHIRKTEMIDAYAREIALIPILIEMEAAGVPVDVEALRADVSAWEKIEVLLDEWIRDRLNAPTLNIDANKDLADALEKAGAIGTWALTAKGNRSISKENLPKAVADEQILHMLSYRGTLTNCLRTFGRPWLEVAENTGKIFTRWNQTVETDAAGKMKVGARTGRFSTTPNFQNIPKPPNMAKMPELIEGLPTLPSMRSYITGGPGCGMIVRDYDGQELRILAHFEDGPLMEAYLKDPTTDGHQYVADMINEEFGTDFGRAEIKAINFGIIYGEGNPALAKNLGVTVPEAKKIKTQYLRTLPGVKALGDDLKRRAKRNEPLRTWGGRVYYCEAPKYVEKYGRVMTFDYKMLNTLIQGSAADCTKQAMINYYNHPDRDADAAILLSVHDELGAKAPVEILKEQARVLGEAMEAVEFDVPMSSDCAMSDGSWQDAKNAKE